MQLPNPPEFRRIHVDRTDDLEVAIAELDGLDALGLDVEMGQRIIRLPGGVNRGKQLLALIQIAGGSLSVTIDPLRVRNLAPLAPVLNSSGVKVLLGGATDVKLLAEHKLPIRNVVDLAETAVAVFGHREEGMQALAARALGIHVEKTIRRENWLRRPIHPAMLSYAHRDAELTLLLYRWFQEHHPRQLADHMRAEYHPEVPATVAPWIQVYLNKRPDLDRLLKEHRISRDPKSRRLTRDVRAAFGAALAPAQQRRLLRLTGDLALVPLFDDILPFAESRSAVFRSSAARALGKLGDARAKPILERLLEDEVSDVKEAAEAAIRDLMEGPAPRTLKEEHKPGLDPKAAAALRKWQVALPSPPPGSADGSDSERLSTTPQACHRSRPGTK